MAKTGLGKLVNSLRDKTKPSKASEVETPDTVPVEPKRNAEEGGRPEFWDNDIDGEEDDAWVKAVNEKIFKRAVPAAPTSTPAA